MKRKLTTLVILMAMVFSVFSVVSASDEIIWETVLEDDFGGDLSKWTNVSDGLAATDGVLDFIGYNMGWLEPDVNKFTDSVSVEFDMLKVSSGLNIRLRDEDGKLLNINFKGYYDINACGFSDGINDNWFGAALLPDETATLKYVINSDGVTMYRKDVGADDSEYGQVGVAYDDAALDCIKAGKGLQVDAIYYQSPLSQPEEKTFYVGDEQVTTTVYPVVVDNLKIKHAKYGTPHFAPAFSDDFTSGNLDNWANESGLFAVNADGKVGLNVFNAYLTPDVEPSKNIMLQFDVTGWMENLYIQFTDPADASNTFRATMHGINITDQAQLWDLGSVWVNYAGNCGINGGTDEEPTVNSVRYILSEGVLSAYLKTENDKDFVYKGSHSFKANDGVISDTAYYVPAFYVIGSLDAAEAEKVLLDNVVVKTIEEKSFKAGAKTIEYTFDTAESLNDWDVPAWFFDGADFRTDRPAYTWNEDGSVFFYPFNSAAYPVNPVNESEFITKVRMDTTNATNQSMYFIFKNVADDSDYVRLRVADWCVCVDGDNVEETFVTGVNISGETGYKTLTFDLKSDSITVSKEDLLSTAVLSGDAFKKYFTENAKYTFGVFSLMYGNAAPINIDSITFETPATTAITSKLFAETAKDVYEVSAMPAAGEKCRVQVKADGSFAGIFIAALYDGDKLIAVKTGTNATENFDFAVPATATAPVVKVMTWETLEGGMPLGGAFVYAAE